MKRSATLLSLGCLAGMAAVCMYDANRSPSADTPPHAGKRIDRTSHHHASDRFHQTVDTIDPVSKDSSFGSFARATDALKKHQALHPLQAPSHQDAGTEQDPRPSKHSPGHSKATLPSAELAATHGLPAVMVELDTPSFPPERQQELNELAAEFLEKVADDAETASDPASQTRWKQAMAESDRQFRVRYGKHAWLQHHNATRQIAQGQEKIGAPPTP